MLENNLGLEWDEFEERLHRFKFKSTTAFFNNWTGSSVIQNVFNREKVRRMKSKEEQILNRLDIWISVCRPRVLRNDITTPRNGKFSTMNLSRIRRPFLRRTLSLEDASSIPGATRLTELLNKRRTRISAGFFRSRSNISTSSSPLERSLEDDSISDVVNFTDDIFNKTGDNQGELIRANKTRRISEKKEVGESGYIMSDKSHSEMRTPNGYGKQKKQLKSQENGFEISRQIRLFPSECPVDPVITSPDSIKSFDERILVEPSLNKFNPYPIFFTSNSEQYNSDKNNEMRNTKNADDLKTTVSHGKKHQKSSERCPKHRTRTGVSSIEEGRNMQCRNTQTIRIHDTYYENKMRYYKDNPLQQTIRKSNDISTMQDYINSIKESRDSIKQCTKDIKKFLGSAPNLSTKVVGSSITPNSTPDMKRETIVTSNSTPYIKKLLTKSEQKPKNLLYTKEDYRKSWSDVKSVLKQESLSEHLV